MRADACAKFDRIVGLCQGSWQFLYQIPNIADTYLCYRFGVYCEPRELWGGIYVILLDLGKWVNCNC